jgi:cytohesin
MPRLVALGSIDHLPERERLLLQAVEQRDMAAMQQQLAAGANPSAADADGLTALHLATAATQWLMVRDLLAAGADVSARTHYKPGSWASNATPLQLLAKDICRPPQARFYRVFYSAGGLMDPVHQCDALCQLQADNVQQLAAAGAQVDVAAAGKDCKRTPLHFAAAAGCSTVVAALLQAGADPGTPTPSGYNVLHAAASSGSLEVMRQVLDALGSSRSSSSSDVAALANMLGQEALDKTRARPLHLAAAGGHLEVVEALVAAGADLEQPDDFGNVALHYAVRHCHCHLVPLLVTPGNVNMQSEELADSANSTPLHMAAVRPKRDSIYQDHPDWKQPVHAAAVRAVEALLAAGADTSVKNAEGLTALGIAAEDDPQVFLVLLRHELRPLLQQQQESSAQRQQQNSAQQQQVPSQQQQQQQQVVTEQPGPHPLRDAAMMALCNSAGYKAPPTWAVLVEEVVDTFGEAGLQTLWADLKQLMLDPEQLAGLPEGLHRALKDHTSAARAALNVWEECWAGACRKHAQRVRAREVLQQLCCHTHQQHQQQQGGRGRAGRPSKRPRLARELRLLLEQQGPLPAPAVSSFAAAGPCGSTRSSRAGSKQLDTVMRKLESAAVTGDEQGVRAFLEQLPDRPKALSVAVFAAGRERHWGLCMGLLRELVMLDATKGQEAVHRLHIELSHRMPEPDGEVPPMPWLDFQDPLAAFEAFREHNQREREKKQLRAALQVCDALLADWLAVRQLPVAGLEEVVVTAVEAAAAAASL